jgi:hypothetical protein
MDWHTPPHWTVFAHLASPPLAAPMSEHVLEREPVLHQETTPPLSEKQRAWLAEKELNRHHKRLSRQSGHAWSALMKLIGDA